MIEIKRITSGDDPIMERLKGLYTEAFPPEERRPVDSLGEAINNHDEMYFCAIYDEGEPAGLVVYWVFPEFAYTEHLAVFAEMRNRKIGQQVLDFLAANFESQILEVEPIRDEMTERRINYYRRNGFEVMEKGYLQPAYSGHPGQNYPLWIMGTGSIPPEKLQEYIRTVKEKVYNCP